MRMPKRSRLPAVNWKTGKPFSYCPECGLTDEDEAMLDAAQEMLELLRLVLSGIERDKLPDQTLMRQTEKGVETQSLSDKIRAAIAKATGGE